MDLKNGVKISSNRSMKQILESSLLVSIFNVLEKTIVYHVMYRPTVPTRFFLPGCVKTGSAGV